MKAFVKTLKGTNFEIQVKSQDTVSDVKKTIESVQGSDVYPAAKQMLIHQGKVLEDETTLEENKVAENSFLVIMLSKNTAPSSSPPATAAAAAPASSVSVGPFDGPTCCLPPSTIQPSAVSQAPTSTVAPSHSPPQSTATPTPAPALTSGEPDVYGQAASNLVAGSNLEGTVQQILDMGGGSWDRDTVIRALRAAFNKPERAVEYLYSGIPEQAEVPPPAQAPPPTGTQPINPIVPAPQVAVPSSGPNANPLDLFPQGIPSAGSNASAGTLDFLRNSQRFQAFRAMVQANPQILQPMLQELGKQNPNLMRLIQDHQADFLRLINEPVEGGEGNPLGQLAEAMPQAVTVTPEEREAIERLEAMGFDRALVLEVFLACNEKEELAANYLLDHMHEVDE